MWCTLQNSWSMNMAVAPLSIIAEVLIERFVNLISRLRIMCSPRVYFSVRVCTVDSWLWFVGLGPGILPWLMPGPGGFPPVLGSDSGFPLPRLLFRLPCRCQSYSCWGCSDCAWLGTCL